MGKTAVPTISGAEVFYVNSDLDAFVEYVYVKSGTIDNSTQNFVMATGSAYYNNLWNNANIYVLGNAYVNGELKTEAIMTANVSNITTLINGVYAPYYVTYNTAGLVDNVYAFSTDRSRGDYTQIGTANLYYGKITEVVACDGNTMVVNGGVSFAINTAKVIGSVASATDVANWADYNVYIVYSKTVNSDRVVSQLYIVDKGLGGNAGDAGVVTPSTGTWRDDSVNGYQYNGTTKQEICLTPYSTTLSDMATAFSAKYVLTVDGLVVPTSGNVITIAQALADGHVLKLVNKTNNADIWTVILSK